MTETKDTTFLQDKELAEYNDSGGTICPYCKSKRIQWDTIEWTDDGADGYVSCLDCGGDWVEDMKRESVMLLDKPDESEENDEND